MKRIISLSLICVILMLTLTGCGYKPLTVDEFKEKAQEKGLTITRDTVAGLNFPIDISEEKKNIESCVLAKITSDVGTTLWGSCFLVADDSVVQSIYNKYKAHIEGFDISKCKIATTKGSNYATYAIITEDQYGYFCYVDNTFLLVDADLDYQNDAEDFAKYIGYLNYSSVFNSSY